MGGLKQGRRGATLLALKMEGETKDCGQPLPAEKGKGMASPLEPPERSAVTHDSLLSHTAVRRGSNREDMGLPSRHYLLSGPLQKKCASLWCDDC